MKMLSVLLLLVFIGVATPQNAPMPAPDSMQRHHCMMMKDGKDQMPASTMPGQCPGAMANAKCQMTAPPMLGKCAGEMENEKCGRHMQDGQCLGAACRSPMFPGHRFAMFLVAKMVFGMLFLGMMLILTANILLTILVCLDMKKRGAFNGLWIPLLLIAGIPVSIAYAIFRLGDMMGERK
jgi:hypothetical protein